MGPSIVPLRSLDDFAPVSLLIVPADAHRGAQKTCPLKTCGELIAWLKANAGNRHGRNTGRRYSRSRGGVLFPGEHRSPFAARAVSWCRPAKQDLVAGQIDCMIDTPTNSLPPVRAGTIKAYAVTEKTRLATAPDIPTVDEAGLGGLHFSIWQALWAPKGTSKPSSTRSTPRLTPGGCARSPAVCRSGPGVASCRPSRPPTRSPPFTRRRSRSGGRS